jgi:hypothetical protein
MMSAPRFRRLAGAVVLVAIGFGVVVPAASIARLFSVGSLGAATASYAHPVDTAFWSKTQANGASPTVPRVGQVRVIRVRGCARPGSGGQSPLTQIHFQTLASRGGDAVNVRATSQPLNMPVCGRGASAGTVTTFHPLYLCARPGDYVAFNDEGGAGAGFPNGVRYKVFGAASGAVTDSFTRAGGTNNGASFTGTELTGVHLLLQYVLGTGHNARPYCRGK